MNATEVIRKMLPRGVHPHRILAGPLRGRLLTTSWHDYSAALLGRTEPELIAWFQSIVQPGDTWLDVGANYGYTSLALCNGVGTHGRVFAFEPMLRTAGHLATTRYVNHLDQLTVVPMALSDVTDITAIQVSIWKSMAQPAGPGTNVKLEEGVKETIYCLALDILWSRLCGGEETVSGIKIDVEGAEMAVLKGMKNVLAKHKPKLVIEVHRSRGVRLEDVTREIANAGYSPTPHLIIGQTDREDPNYEFRPYL